MSAGAHVFRISLCLIVCGAALLLAVPQARPLEPPRYFQYTREQLQQYETTLKPRMNQYKQAAEQLANFGNQTAWLAHREADGLVEIHENWSDLMYVVSGAASLRVGGEMDRPYTESPGELRSAMARGQITFFTMKIVKP